MIGVAVPMRMMPVRVSPVGIVVPRIAATAVPRIIPRIAPWIMPAGVPSESDMPSGMTPSEIYAPVEMSVKAPAVKSGTVPNDGPDILGIGAEKQ